MAQLTEIAPDLFRVSVFVPEIDLQFNQYLVRDDEPLLFHTGTRRMFPEVKEAVARVIDVESLRWISWSHFEVDECGALNEWLKVAPNAVPVTTEVGAMVNMHDVSDRPTRGLKPEERIDTGKHRYRLLPTPQVPHSWDAGMMFEEKNGILFCSDLFHQLGQVEPVTSNDVVGRFDHALATYQSNPVTMDYMPFSEQTREVIERLAALQPKVLAAMHGSAFRGDGAAALRSAADVMERRIGRRELVVS